MNIVDKLTLPENLYWAWHKVRRYYRGSDEWFDEAAMACFEAGLEDELLSIASEFKNGHYAIRPLRPLAHPKAPDGENNQRARQVFWVAVRDQVAWLALVNVIGPVLDTQMPVWSYGNRLYRSAWFSDDDDHSWLHLGPYRNTQGHLYRRFHQSWPVYRRHIFLAVRKMTRAQDQRIIELDQAEQRVLDAEEHLPDPLRLPYLKDEFWKKPGKDVYWASVDLEKFYPRINLATVRGNLLKYGDSEIARIEALVTDLLTFPLDLSGWSSADLEALGLEPPQQALAGIPTGLMAAGFLANVAMLDLDRKVARRVRAAQIAHFRYVDDHTFLAQDFEGLLSWIADYKSLLEQCRIGTGFNREKVAPKELQEHLVRLLDGEKDLREAADDRRAAKGCRIDPRFPSPLMTSTLAKVSGLARIEFDLLHHAEQQAVLNDLEHLLLAELPNAELREDTRVSFAATMIARLAPRAEPVADGAAHIVATKRARKRVFLLLLKALREHPEKLRLWTRILEYCAFSGYTDLQPMREEIDALAKANPLTTSYQRARLLQILSRQVVECAGVILSLDFPTSRRRAARRYLAAICEEWMVQLPGPTCREYELASANLFRCGVGTALLMLESQRQATDLVNTSLVNRLRRAARVARAIDWKRDARAWAATSGHPLPVWTWWAENKSNDPAAVTPGPISAAVAEQLDPDDRLTWAVWQRYPAQFPRVGVRRLLSGRKKVAREHYGWLFDVMASAPEDMVGRYINKQFSPWLKVLTTARIAPQGKVTLFDWTEWTKDRYEREPFDPRVGEWTALRLTSEITACLLSEKLDVLDPGQGIHPSNVLIPESWVHVGSEPLTWETWRRKMGEHRPRIRRPLICDSRLAPSWSPNPSQEGSWRAVHTVGLLLLGLLRRSFCWPASWNTFGQQQARASLAWQLIKHVPCSSWTSAILEACLTPRSRETVLLKLFSPPHFRVDDDTTRDPPGITDLRSLKRLLRRAEQVLEGYQITIRGHLPRQLVPLRFEQLNRDTWSEDPDAEGDA